MSPSLSRSASRIISSTLPKTRRVQAMSKAAARRRRILASESMSFSPKFLDSFLLAQHARCDTCRGAGVIDIRSSLAEMKPSRSRSKTCTAVVRKLWHASLKSDFYQRVHLLRQGQAHPGHLESFDELFFCVCLLARGSPTPPAPLDAQRPVLELARHQG